MKLYESLIDVFLEKPLLFIKQQLRDFFSIAMFLLSGLALLVFYFHFQKTINEETIAGFIANQWRLIFIILLLGVLVLGFLRRFIRPIFYWDSKKLTVLVADFEDDESQKETNETSVKEIVLNELEKFPGVLKFSIPETLSAKGFVHEDVIQENHGKARSLLKRYKADILIWGRVLKRSGITRLDLYLTAPEASSNASKSKGYFVQETRLGEIFINDIAGMIQIIVEIRTKDLINKREHFVANPAKILLDKTEKIFSNAEAFNLTENNFKYLKLLRANLLAILGHQTSNTEAYLSAIQSYKELLKIFTKEKTPLEWYSIQNMLGNALSSLGNMENGTGYLEESVCAYREALKGTSKDKNPVDWAATKSNLGAALSVIGEKENNTAKLIEALQLLRESQEVRTIDKMPFMWAKTQTSISNTLKYIGQRDQNLQYLEEAVDGFQRALKAFPRSDAPFQ